MNETDPTMANAGPHQEADPEKHRTDETSVLTQRQGPDLLTLAAGLGALGIAGTALLGGLPWLPDLDARWVLAAVALVVGLALVIGSLRSPRRGSH
ncbi:MAG: hypothetical protein M3460_04095 [Actinomycetota bacterium]|nr:hypothetical protein [Actinomycetota bacterium]